MGRGLQYGSLVRRREDCGRRKSIKGVSREGRAGRGEREASCSINSAFLASLFCPC